jgi:hypothetical protein
MKHFLNDIEISPRNRTEIGITSDFTGDPNVLNLSVENVVLPREAFDIVKQHVLSQGLFEGIPYRIEMEGGIVLNYYVDLVDSNTKFRDYECEVQLKRRKGQDQFWENAQGTSFELMLSKGMIYQLTNIPYVVVQPNLWEQALTLSIAFYVMGKELIEAGQALVDSFAELIQATTLNAGVPPSVDTGDVIVLVIKTLARAAYFALTLYLLIDLGSQIVMLIFPPIRYHLGCKFKELCVKSCAFLGYQFESTIFDSEPQWTHLPVPLVKDRQSIFDLEPSFWNNAFTKGVPSASDTTPTFGLFLEALETMFNAQVKVNNGVVRLERRDWWMDQASNQLITALALQDKRIDQYRYNTEDVWKRYYIHYQTDFSDIHTLDGELYDVHNAEFSTEPTSFLNSDLITIKGLQDVNIPFALGARKNKLNWVENYAFQLAGLIDSVTSAFGGGTNFQAQIGDRKNVLMVSQQFYSISKVLWTENGRQPSTYLTPISANGLWNRYHYINQIQENDWIIKEQVRLRMSSVDFVSLQDNNFAEIDGVLCEILKIEWIDEKSFAQITYRERNNYSSGKVVTIEINQ